MNLDSIIPFLIIFFPITVSANTPNQEYVHETIDSLKAQLHVAEDSAKVDILNQIAYNYYYYKNDSTEEFAKMGMQLATSLNYLRGLSESQRLLGIYYKAHNKNKLALEWLFKGLKTAESIEYNQGIADNLNSLGIAYDFYGEKSKAIAYFKRSVKYQKLSFNVLREALALSNIGGVYLKENEFDSARVYFEKALNILDEVGDPKWIAMIYSEFSSLLIQTGELNKAELYSNMALSYSLQENLIFQERKSYQNLAEIHLLNGDNERSLEMARLALQKSKEGRFLPYIQESHRSLYSIYKMIGDTEKALIHHEKYVFIRDSTENSAKASLPIEPNYRMVLAEKEKENVMLRKENESKEIRNKERELVIQRQTFFGLIILIALIFVSAAAFVFYKLRQKEKQANEKLKLSNLKLAEQKEELASTLQFVELLNAQLQAQNNTLNKSAIVCITNLSGTIISANDNFCNVSGYKREEVLGMNVRSLNSGEHSDEFFINLWKDIRRGNTWRGDLKNKSINGDYFWCDTAIAPIIDDNGNPKQFFALQFEITKRKQYLEEISQKSQELEETNKLKDKLFSIVSHDFRSPLNSLRGSLDLLLQGIISNEEFKIIAANLTVKLDHTHDLLENLLNWARSQMQGINVDKKQNSLKEIANDCTTLLTPVADKKQIAIVNEIDEGYNAYADSEMVKVVMRNLLSNAIKFSLKNSKVVLSATKEEENVIVSVKDSGLGISDENQKKLFQNENYTTLGTGNEKGIGIGLMLCKDFIEQNGGKLWFESSESKGSTFSFSLPATKTAVTILQS